MPVLTVSYSFSFSGITFGGAGSPYQIVSVDGLEGVPLVRNQDDNRGFNDGMFSGQDFFGGRTISIIFNTFSDGVNSAQTNFNTIQAKLLPQTTGTTPLYFILPPSGEQFIDARVRSIRTTVNPEYTYGFITSQVDFFCPNPLYFDSTLQTASMNVSNPLGRTYNRIYNLLYGGGSTAITTTVTNSGWANTYPTITLNGPITNPILGNTTQGELLTFTGTYTNTDSLVVDLYNKLITLNGDPARNLLSTGNWFSASPGANLFFMTGNTTTIGITAATIAWRNAYI